jgi:formylglycine-generating enzyme required for sulfatase activity
VSGETVTWNREADGYRLPTEAEWEYACRSETTPPFSTGGNITTDQANYRGAEPYNPNPAGVYREKTTEVGIFARRATATGGFIPAFALRRAIRGHRRWGGRTYND